MATAFTLNGLEHKAEADPTTPLIYVLRNELQLHGAKLGCGLEQCGACLVLVDDDPVYSCTTPLADVAGKCITTVEGLVGPDAELDPIQRAFIDLNAAQCGFCTAGIIVRIKALLDAKDHPSAVEVRQAIDGHLCRCGAHPQILRAVERAIAAKHAGG